MDLGEEIKIRYDVTSDSYDELYGEEQRDKYRFLFSKVKPYGIVADIGCGTGLLIEYLSEVGLLDQIEKYYCLDFSENMIKIANKKIDKICKNKCIAMIGNAEKLPFRNKSIDFLFSFSVINLVDNPDEALKEILRVSKYSYVTIIKKLRNVIIKGVYIGENEKDLFYMIS